MRQIKQIMSMQGQEHEECRNRLEEERRSHESSIAEYKEMEEFLETESLKKEEEIKSLKEEAIKKEKNYSMMRAQVGQLEAEITNLKAQLKEFEGSTGASSQASKELEDVKKKYEELQAEYNRLQVQMNTKQGQKQESINSEGAKVKKLEEQIEKLNKELSVRNDSISELQKAVESSKTDAKNPQPKVEQKRPPPSAEKERNSEGADKKHYEGLIAKLERKLEQAINQSQRSEQTSLKLSRQLKQLKAKNKSMEMDREGLLKKISSLSKSGRREQQIEQSVMNEGEVESEVKEHNSFSALIMTKKHYISPFLQLKGSNTIKLFKSTKNGCFEKSLGSTKYKLHEISYDPSDIVNNCCKNLLENLANNTKCSVVLYGPKKTTKKYLMAHIAMSMKEFLLERLAEWKQEEGELYAEFIKASQNPEEKVELRGKNKEEIEAVIERVILMTQKSPKKHDGRKKSPSKPKARIFKIIIGELSLEVITSSFTSVTIRDSTTVTDALNHLCYARLPNALQQVDCYRQIILTVNPIVSLYEDCRNTLALSNCKKGTHQEAHFASDWQDSPSKDDLNVSAKKKFESIERQSEQNSLRVKRLEDEVSYYKSKFDELEIRIKNLLNTHNPQNSYLKKSPVTLSYEKMLKFVHSVLARNTLHASRMHEDPVTIEDGFASNEDEVL